MAFWEKQQFFNVHVLVRLATQILIVYRYGVWHISYTASLVHMDSAEKVLHPPPSLN